MVLETLLKLPADSPNQLGLVYLAEAEQLHLPRRWAVGVEDSLQHLHDELSDDHQASENLAYDNPICPQCNRAN